ncbi:hypothetical protein F5144DRAFT_591019 [Chaetomium tenue]|uniref:Uncharacterized protein n=1 Tax=Chaetomium tenue TaxID=1854479 RepID=A0ACB7PNC0_9PEZI|nr:hypothetical protein F5144DRAFT_591019 [Chaetomium globosum]
MPSRIWLQVFDKSRCACAVNTAWPVPNWELAECERDAHLPSSCRALGITREPLLLESLLPVSASHFRNFPTRCLVRVPCQVQIVAPNLLFQVIPRDLKISSTQRLLRVGNARPGCDHPNLEIIAPKSQQSEPISRRRMHVSPAAACSQPDAKTVGRASAAHVRPAAPMIFKSSSERAEGHNARPNPALQPGTVPARLGLGTHGHSHPAAPHGTSQPRLSPSPKFSSHPSHRLVPLRGDIPQLRKCLFQPFSLDIHLDWPSMLAGEYQVTGGPQAGRFPSPAPSTTRPQRVARVPPLWHARLTGQEQA